MEVGASLGTTRNPTTRRSKAERKLSKCELIRDMQLDTPAGCCIFCECKLGLDRRVVCSSVECHRSYQRVYHAWQRALRADKGLTQRGTSRKNKSWVGSDTT